MAPRSLRGLAGRSPARTWTTGDLWPGSRVAGCAIEPFEAQREMWPGTAHSLPSGAGGTEVPAVNWVTDRRGDWRIYEEIGESSGWPKLADTSGNARLARRDGGAVDNGASAFLHSPAVCTEHHPGTPAVRFHHRPAPWPVRRARHGARAASCGTGCTTRSTTEHHPAAGGVPRTVGARRAGAAAPGGDPGPWRGNPCLSRRASYVVTSPRWQGRH